MRSMTFSSVRARMYPRAIRSSKGGDRWSRSSSGAASHRRSVAIRPGVHQRRAADVGVSVRGAPLV
jgi:hypothetical protein